MVWTGSVVNNAQLTLNGQRVRAYCPENVGKRATRGGEDQAEFFQRYSQLTVKFLKGQVP